MPIASFKPRQWLPEQIVNIKPYLRGWIHLITAPLSLAASIVLLALAPTAGTKWASAVYLAASLILFGVSATYHLAYWAPGWEQFWRRLDHSNIFLLIAGTYTPLSVSLLEYTQARNILLIVWIGAVLGILINLFWPAAPRWLGTFIYVALGWVAIAYLPALWAAGGPAIVWLLIAGGLLYTIGAVFYALKWPNPSPKWFGFHEMFHACTVLAWACHCVAVYLAVLN